MFVVFIMLCSFVIMPAMTHAGSISDDIEDLIEDLEDWEDDLQDLEEEISDSYGSTVEVGDIEGDNTTVKTAENLYITSLDGIWSSTDYIYVKGLDSTSVVSDGDTRVLPYDTFFGNTSVNTGEGDTGTSYYQALNLGITGTDTLWTSTEGIYATTSTVVVGDTRVTKGKIIMAIQLNALFNDIEAITDDIQDELDDLKGENIPSNDMDDLSDAVADTVEAAEDVVDEIDNNVHSVMDDEFTDKEDDFKDDIDDINQDLSDVENGVNTDNDDIDDFKDELNDIEDNVEDKSDDVGNSILTENDISGHMDDLDNLLEDAEDEIDDLEDEEFTTAEQAEAQNAWDDLEDAFNDVLNDIEDAVDNGNTADLDDVFEDDYRSDFEDDLSDAKDKLDGILSGTYSNNVSSRKVENAVDDIEDAKDEVKEDNSTLLNSYGETIATGDDDLGIGVTATTLYIGGENDSWSLAKAVYSKKNGNNATTLVEVGDTRITNFSTSYRAGTEVNAIDTDADTDLFETTFYETGGVYYYDVTDLKTTASTKRVNRSSLMLLTELQDLFEEIEDNIDDVEDALQDIQGLELNSSEISDIESMYNKFVDKTEDYIEDIDDTVHSTLDDFFDDLEDDHNRKMDDLESLINDIKDGTSTTVADRVTDFEDELNDLEDDIDAEKNDVTSAISSNTVMRNHFNDLEDIIDDVDDEIEDLAGYSYTDTEVNRIKEAFEDIESASDDAIEKIEDNIDDTLEDDFDDEKDDLEGEIDSLSGDLDAILSGGTGSSRAINDLIDDLKDARDDIDDVYDTLGLPANSTVSDRGDIRGFSDDIQDGIDDAIEAIEDYDEQPSSLGIARIKSTLNSLEDKTDDAVDLLKDNVEAANEDNLDENFDDEEDDIKDKMDELDEAAQYLYSLAPEDTSGDTGETGDETENEAGEPGDETGSEPGDEPAATITPVTFVDVSSLNVFKEEIEALSSLGIINGYYDGTFRPNNPVTRGEFMKIVAGAAEADVSSPSGIQSFRDVPTYHAFYKWIDYASRMGYSNGYSDGSFKPEAYITRYEAAVILLRFRGISPSITPTGSNMFIDITSPEMAGYTDAAFDNGIFNGRPDNTFGPQDKITRGETAKVAANAFS